MMATLSMERLLLLVECPICFEKLDELNRMLPCQHTFCKQCLERVIEKSDELRCPECRTLHTKSINYLQPNILVIRILEFIQQSEREAQNLKCGDMTCIDEKLVSPPFLFKFQAITTACESQGQHKNKINVGPNPGNLQKKNHFSFYEKSANTGTQDVSGSENRTIANPQTSSSSSAQIGKPCDRFCVKNCGQMLRLGSTREQEPNDDNIGSSVSSSGQELSPFRFEAHSLNSPECKVHNNGSKKSIRRAHLFPVELAKGEKRKIVASSGQKDEILERKLNLSKNALCLNAPRLSNGSSKVTSLTIGKNVFSPIAVSGSPSRLSCVKIGKIAPSSNSPSTLSSGRSKVTPLTIGKNVFSPITTISDSSSRLSCVKIGEIAHSSNLPSTLSSESSKVTPLTIGKTIFRPITISGSPSRSSSESSKVTPLTIGKNVFSPITTTSDSPLRLSCVKIGEIAHSSILPSRLSSESSKVTPLTIGKTIFRPITISGSPSRLSSESSKVTSLTIGKTIFSPIALSSGLSRGLLNGELKMTPLEIDKNASTSSVPSRPPNDGFKMAIFTNKDDAQSPSWNCAASSSNGSLNIVKDKNVFTFQAVAQPKTSARKYNDKDENFKSGSKEASQSFSNVPTQNNSKIAQTVAQSFILQLPSNAQNSISSRALEPKLFDPKSYCFNVKLK